MFGGFTSLKRTHILIKCYISEDAGRDETSLQYLRCPKNKHSPSDVHDPTNNEIDQVSLFPIYLHLSHQAYLFLLLSFTMSISFMCLIII